MERDDDVADAQGERRTAAEAYHARIDFSSPDQARRYLELVEDVLEHYPEGAEEPDPVGSNLRKQLGRAGIVRGTGGHLELPMAAVRAAESLESATEGIWTPERIRVFISHTSAHRSDAALLAQHLNTAAFSCFVAHDAIEPTRQWQDVIERALDSCDALVAYVTPDFNASRWTDQEVGWALGRGVVVIPVKVGHDPYGFFGAYQAVAVREGTATWETGVAVARAMAIAIFRGQRPGAGRLIRPMADAVVEAFCSSGSFDTTRRRFELLTLIPRNAWTASHTEALQSAAENNPQVREAQLPDRRPVPEAIARLVGTRA